MLRFAAVGSVDDGKSTLIGRLLHDTKQLFDDQIEAVSHASRRRGREDIDLSFVTDGLRAEREQGITIDVAYRYAATPRRKFVIADCPGHTQYTRNMATGASTADLAVVVVDVEEGLREQTRRHCAIASLLGVRHLVVAVNKMDLAGWDRARFERTSGEMAEMAGRLGIDTAVEVPVSALHGDNIVARSTLSSWYEGPTILEALESATCGAWAAEGGSGWRLPVQWVTRRTDGSRAYAGMLVGGSLKNGEQVVVLPAGRRARVTSIGTFDGELDGSPPSLSIDVGLDDDLDVSRGDLIAPSGRAPRVTNEIEATICWFREEPLVPDSRYRIKHTTRVTPARVAGIVSRLDLATLDLEAAVEIGFNDIGVVNLRTATPLAVDPYRENRVTGSFVVIDEVTNRTVAAGMVGAPSFG